MRALIQRVKSGSVEVDNQIISKINQGIVLLVGIEDNDDFDDIDWICKKVSQLRIFDDEGKVMNKSLVDIDGEILIISQFTLHAMTKKGNRPSYIRADKSDYAKTVYNQFLTLMENHSNNKPHAGVFGADMLVKIENDGPVTIMIDSKNRSY